MNPCFATCLAITDARESKAAMDSCHDSGHLQKCTKHEAVRWRCQSSKKESSIVTLAIMWTSLIVQC